MAERPVKRFLGRRDVEADAKDSSSKTLLAIAVRGGHSETVRLLLDHSRDSAVNIRLAQTSSRLGFNQAEDRNNKGKQRSTK